MENKQNTKSKKKIVGILAAIGTLLLVSVLSVTFALYFSSASGSASKGVAKWAVKVKVNTETAVDIVTSNSLTLQLLNDATTADVVTGKIAPGCKMYADFEIDPTDSEVAIDYSFKLGTISAEAGSVPAGLTVSKVCLRTSGADGTALSSSGEGANKVYTGTISLPGTTGAYTKLTASQKVTVRVYVSWAKGDTQSEQADDTAVGKIGSTLTIPVTLEAKQHVAA